MARCDIILKRMAQATYVYCVLRSAGRPASTRVPAGIPSGAPPAIASLGGSLWLVVSDVPLDVYGPERLEAALGDLDWVARVAVAHEAVVEHFARRRAVTVVPMKLFTMFSTVERAAREMRARRRAISGVLRRVAGCEEWGVRVTRGTPPRRATAAAAPVARSGVAFLAARREARDRAREAAAGAVTAADTAFDALAPLARDVRRRDSAPGGAVPLLLDAAFLVPTSRRARFQAVARRTAALCAESGAIMTLTGPWPPYNFVQPGDAA